MSKSLLVLSVFLFGQLVFSGPKHSDKKADPNATEFGAKVATGKAESLSNVVSNFGDFQGKDIIVEASTKKVCKQSGCWMVLQDGEYEVRTMFKDYGFFVPPNLVGKRVRVQGQLEEKKVSAATIRHLMKDEGKKLADIQKVKSGRTEIRFIATGVQLVQ